MLMYKLQSARVHDDLSYQAADASSKRQQVAAEAFLVFQSSISLDPLFLLE